MSLPTTISEALAHARRIAAASGEALTPSTAQALLAHITGRGRAWLFAHGEQPLSAADAARFVALLGRAAAGEPLAHLTGAREFYGLAFSVTPDVLIPRPETEALVDVTLEWAQARALPTPRIIDVGTGSGAIAVALAVKLPQACIVAADISWEALVIARANAQRHGVAERLSFVLADLLEGLAGPFDAIAANLPYINREELAALEVGRWEPLVALDGGPDGLDMVRRLLQQAPSRIAPGGLLVLEIGSDQGARAAALCRDAFPLARVSILPDLAGRERVIRVDIP
jgi:release factor glutamine methyltransferase